MGSGQVQSPAAEAEAAPDAGAGAGADRPRREGSGGWSWKAFAARYGLLVAFAVTILAFSLARPDAFPTVDNLKSILTAAAPMLIVSLGLTVVLVMRDFDLSFGAMIGLAGGAAVVLMADGGQSWLVAILVALALGLAAGLANGFVVAYLGASSFIVTLAMGTILTGVEFSLTDQKTIFGAVSPTYAAIGQDAPLLGLNNQIWIAAALALVTWLALDKSELGRYMYAIGGNPEAARLSGVPLRRLRVAGFVAVAVGAAIVGVLLTSASASSVPNTGTPYLLPAYAAVFLGSAVFRPGEFNVLGTVVGVLFLGAVQTGLTMLDLATFVINLVQGAILLAAVLISRIGAR